MKKSHKSKIGGFRPGSGRPPLAEGESSVTLSFKVTESEAAAIDKARGDESRSHLVRRLLMDWLNRKS